MKKITPRPRSQLVAAVLPGLTRRTASAIHCAMCSGRRTQRMPANKNARAITMLKGQSQYPGNEDARTLRAALDFSVAYGNDRRYAHGGATDPRGDVKRSRRPSSRFPST